MLERKILRISPMLLRLGYSFGLFENVKRQSKIPKRGNDWWKKDEQKKPFHNHQKSRQIKRFNQHYLGIRLNTNYLKVHNEELFSNLISNPGRAQISQLPFELKENVFQKRKGNEDSDVVKHLMSKMKQEALNKCLFTLAKNYFDDLLSNNRNCLMEPNFEREARKTILGLKKEKYEFELEETKNTNIEIKQINLVKGLRVHRNDNYSTDSYQIQRLDDQLTVYSLWQKQFERIPEDEWLSMNHMIMRITFTAKPYNISIKKGDTQYKSENTSHQFIAEMDMRQPPSCSYFRLSFTEYLMAFRPALDKLTMTNVDRKNPFFSLTYEEGVKQSTLINVLI